MKLVAWIVSVRRRLRGQQHTQVALGEAAPEDGCHFEKPASLLVHYVLRYLAIGQLDTFVADIIGHGLDVTSST